MALRSGTDQHRSLTSSHSCRVKELVSIHGLLTFFFFLCFLPAECSQNGLKPGAAAKRRKGWFSCRCCGIMRHSPLQTECHFTMPISAIARCNLHLPPMPGERRTAAETLDLGHGRIEQRWLQTSNVLMGYSDWPGLAQVFRLERQVIIKKTGEGREEVVAGVTSLVPARADAARLLTLIRGQWQIESQSHWVRDVTFDEDRSQVRCGNILQVMAALRNTVIGLMRWAGYTNMAAACRRFAAQPTAVLRLIGITLEN